MLRKIVRYENFDGDMVEKTLYFNLSEAEIIEMETMDSISLSGLIRRISYEKDISKIVEFVKVIVLKAYGERTPDGEFIKNQTIRDKFASSEAYSALFMEILDGEGTTLADFVNSIVSKSVMKKADEISKMDPASREKIDNYIRTGDFKEFQDKKVGDANAENSSSGK